MLIIPAIDIQEGRCVRLRQGRMDDPTVFSDQPEEMARRWCAQGAERLHVVDLDGALKGKPVNAQGIGRLIRAAPVPVQLGGGIRDLATMRAYFDLGVAYLILGTVAWKHPEIVSEAVAAFSGRILLGIDAREGRVALEGWTEEVARSPLETAQAFDGAGIGGVIYTDIAADGMQTGPNVAATRELAQSLSTPVIASGGIGGIEHVRALLALEEDGVVGMITGRALYEGTLDLASAVALSRECRKRV
jgi:phosphoribosylformimino-5-aminoimidazole carboxamide ribotide isomerase